MLDKCRISRGICSLPHKTERIQVAEAVYRMITTIRAHWMYFLLGTLPLAESPRAVGSKIFIYPTDWQVELMYDGGAVFLLRRLQRFQCNSVIRVGSNAFDLSLSRTGLEQLDPIFARGVRRSFTVADFVRSHSQGAIPQSV